MLVNILLIYCINVRHIDRYNIFDIISNMREIIENQINELEESLKYTRQEIDNIDPSYYEKWQNLVKSILEKEEKLQMLLNIKKRLFM